MQQQINLKLKKQTRPRAVGGTQEFNAARKAAELRKASCTHRHKIRTHTHTAKEVESASQSAQGWYPQFGLSVEAKQKKSKSGFSHFRPVVGLEHVNYASTVVSEGDSVSDIP